MLQAGKKQTLLYREEDWGPERGRGLDWGAQKINERATEATDSSFRAANWMVNFPTLSSPPPDKYPPLCLPPFSSVPIYHHMRQQGLSKIMTTLELQEPWNPTLAVGPWTSCIAFLDLFSSYIMG